ncbi:RHS repeat-associated core domain-containing protein, partial [Verrucomicrobium spinosum]|uniref:RHS repeat-associated core domain-containing protein n=1 Tax=Verrucomicrobium spinosum TaxID=2736 RepID=UPI00210DD9F8
MGLAFGHPVCVRWLEHGGRSGIPATAEDAPPTFGGGTAGPYWRRTYVWGEDLSGSLQGAGGVGGLLLINRHERGSKPLRTSWATSDLNGNVIGLVESNLKAVYEYDPFGKSLRVSEPEEDLNPFRFSTKYTDAETGLSYYGYRYYDAVRGRWMNRDPIEEQGGSNLYGMIGNSAVNKWDYLGCYMPMSPAYGGAPVEAPPILAGVGGELRAMLFPT